MLRMFLGSGKNPIESYQLRQPDALFWSINLVQRCSKMFNDVQMQEYSTDPFLT